MQETLKKIIKNYGMYNQINMVIEEMAELTMAIMKLKRDRTCEAYFENFIEEIADVKIMIEQLIIIVGNQRVDEVIKYKLERMERRMESE